jgi:hypothetical protein
MSVYKIIIHGPFYSGKPTSTESGDTDHICSSCGEWCTLKSSCSNRYHFVQGTWDIPPHGVYPSENGEPDVIPICDQCWIQYDIGEYGNAPNIIVFDNNKSLLSLCPTFSVDSNFRVND